MHARKHPILSDTFTSQEIRFAVDSTYLGSQLPVWLVISPSFCSVFNVLCVLAVLSVLSVLLPTAQHVRVRSPSIFKSCVQSLSVLRCCVAPVAPSLPKKRYVVKPAPKHKTVAKETQRLLMAMKIRRPAKTFYQGIPVQQLQWWQLQQQQQQQLHEQHQLMLLQELSFDEEEEDDEEEYEDEEDELTQSGIRPSCPWSPVGVP